MPRPLHYSPIIGGLGASSLEKPTMKLIADALIDLPYKLDFCAIGPDVEPLTLMLGDTDATLFFPPSLAEGTDGQGVFGKWAWWTGKSLRLVLEREIDSADDLEPLRDAALVTGNTLLRRFLNAYRVRFRRPDVHPVRIDSRALSLEALHDDGRREALLEPISAFFYQQMPADPPLSRSVNATTREALLSDIAGGYEPSLAEQLELDADALDAYGETERAALLRQWAQNVK